MKPITGVKAALRQMDTCQYEIKPRNTTIKEAVLREVFCFQHAQQLHLWLIVNFDTLSQQQPQQTLWTTGITEDPEHPLWSPTTSQAEHEWGRLCLSCSSWDPARRSFSLLPLSPSQPSNKHWHSHLSDIPSSSLIWRCGWNQQLASNHPNIIPPSSSFPGRLRERQQGRTKELVEVSHLDLAQPLCLLLCQRGAVFSTVS